MAINQFPYLEFDAVNCKGSQGLLAVFTTGFSVQAILEDFGLLNLLPMSVLGYKETSGAPKSTSALPPKADLLVAVTDFRL